MDYKLSPQLSKALILSKEEADRMHHRVVGSGHLLLGLLREDDRIGELLRRFDIDVDRLRTQTIETINGQSANDVESHTTFSLNEEATRILKIGCLEARLFRSELVNTEHLLLAMLRDSHNMAGELLKGNHVTYKDMTQVLNLKTDISAGFNFDEDEYGQADEPASRNAKNEKTATPQADEPGDTPMMDSFGVDLTKAAAEGKLDPVVGRENEIRRIAQILCRRKKNNPVLIGEPGVGKSAIVEGLAQLINSKKVYRPLQRKRIIALDMANVVAGTKYRGQFEERIRNIIQELQKNPDIILFIDEIHTIIGAGSAPGTMDAANMLKPALSRGEVQCIGATTIDEYRKSIEKDGALERRFQKVMVEPTGRDETLQILNNIKDKYEAHHHVSYSDEAIKACVDLSERYLSDRAFPDKAIDVMDEAGSRTHIQHIAVPEEITRQEQLVADLIARKEQAVKEQEYERAAQLRDEALGEQKRLDALNAAWLDHQEENRTPVGRDEIEAVVSMMSGVPVQRLAKSETERLKGMREHLAHAVIGQDKAIDKVVRAVTRSRIGIKDPNKPIGTFMFLGPTGVGKTHLAKSLAKFMFGTTDSLIRIEMSEYMEKYNVSRLVGAPPGYVGYDEGGQLTERVRRHPYSIVLLDEIEKAHPDVFNLLLQVLDEGRLTDGNGVTVDFRNTVIILTSNCGTKQLKEAENGIGFAPAAHTAEAAEGVVRKALNKRFSPEFLNRLDDVITFGALDQEAIRTIAGQELAQLTARIAKLGYTLRVTPEAFDLITAKGFDVQYGARPLKRAIQTYVEDKVGEFIVEQSPEPDTALELGRDAQDTFVKVAAQNA